MHQQPDHVLLRLNFLRYTSGRKRYTIFTPAEPGWSGSFKLSDLPVDLHGAVEIWQVIAGEEVSNLGEDDAESVLEIVKLGIFGCQIRPPGHMEGYWTIDG